MRSGKLLSSAMLVILIGSSSSVGAVELPRVINVTIPAYPAVAVANRVSGAVLVDVEVNAEGKVTEANAISGPVLLREAAKKAALRWRFERVNVGEASRSVRLTFIFHEPSYVAPKKKKPKFTNPYQAEVEWAAAVDCFNNC